MKTTIELAKECGFKPCRLFDDDAPTFEFTRKQLEAFRQAVEADYVSRCTFEGYKNSDNTPIYTLPKETK